jgi:NADH-quinone oxidoreductase subunit L
VLSFTRIWESVGLLGAGEGPWVGQEGLLAAAGILVFMGCVSKSAQFPLHVWLPDAMEGPTPVSALIHAATMVAAGVYLIVRMFPLLAGAGYLLGDWFSSPALVVVAMVGAFTAIFSGSIALVQTDLKKGLAYSTCSQLGYMVMAVGVGSIGAAMFHLFTHAFFKACLFLGSGSVIHAVHSQELSDMGGLRRRMPVTHATFLISCLAISGCFLFSGFLSKEAILLQGYGWAAFHGAAWAWIPIGLATITALLTAFYMFRLHVLTFYGPPGNPEKFEHAHESPPSMTIPLVVLAILGVIAGGLALPGKIGEAGGSTWFPDRVNDAVLVKEVMVNPTYGADAASRAIFETQQAPDYYAHQVQPSWNATVTRFWEGRDHGHVPMLLVTVVALLGAIPLAFVVFLRHRDRDMVAGRPVLEAGRNLLRNLYYVDYFYSYRVVPLVKTVMNLLWTFDKRVIDGAVNGAAAVARGLCRIAGFLDSRGVDGAVRGTCELTLAGGNLVRRLVNGKIQDYVKYTVVGMAILLLLVVLAT